MAMAGLDLPVHPLVDVLNEQFAGLIERGAIDIVVDIEGDAVEIQSDEWTLHFDGWPLRSAFIALDTITDTEAEHRLALNAALGPRDVAALSASNEALDGEIVRSLLNSGDGASRTLAELLET
jgi:hypothetical protein